MTHPNSPSIDIDAARLGAFGSARTIRSTFLRMGWVEQPYSNAKKLETEDETRHREALFLGFLLSDQLDAGLEQRLAALGVAVGEACAMVACVKGSGWDDVEQCRRLTKTETILAQAERLASHLVAPLEPVFADASTEVSFAANAFKKRAHNKTRTYPDPKF